MTTHICWRDVVISKPLENGLTQNLPSNPLNLNKVYEDLPNLPFMKVAHNTGQLFLVGDVSKLICCDGVELCTPDFFQDVTAYFVTYNLNEFVLDGFGGVAGTLGEVIS